MPPLLNVYIEESARPPLTELIKRGPDHFKLVQEPGKADIILFETDDPAYIRNSQVYRQFKKKCVVVSETDLPTYFLPACYTSNSVNWLSGNRSVTIPYFLSQISVPNPFIGEIDENAKRQYLYSFRGGATSWVRKRMLKLLTSSADTLIQDTNFYRHWNFDAGYASEKRNHQKDYADILSNSSFVLCPRGAGVSSIRLFEVMNAGRVPVVIADGWIPVKGIPWEQFAIFIPESKILDIDRIIRARQSEAFAMGKRARMAWQQYCSPGADAAVLAESLHALREMVNPAREAGVRRIYPVIETWQKTSGAARLFVRSAVLKTFSLLGIKFPYSLNR